MHLMDIEILSIQGTQTHHLKAYQMSVERNSRHCKHNIQNHSSQAAAALEKVVFMQQLRTLYCLSMNFTQLLPKAQQFTPY